MTEKQVASCEFGPYRLFPSERLLLREGRLVSLTPKVFDTLLVFLRHSRRLLSKDELMEMIWGDTVVEEGNLTQNIFVLRKTLGESPQDHQYLVTLPLQGYRFVAKVKECYDETEAAALMRPENSTGVDDKALKSIAVMPFTLLTNSPAQDFAGIGIADALITKLSNIQQLVVRPTSAVPRLSLFKK